ncbi:MAG: CDP-alcohol phosphatidyltransferase family protein [Pseudomonadota bacterium]
MMAFTYPNTHRPTLRRRFWPVAGTPATELASAAVLGAFGVAAIAYALPGAVPGTIALAVAAYVLASAVAVWGVLRTYPHDRLGLCNHITLVRLVLVSALMAPLMAGAPPSWAFFALAAVALSLDGVDGWLARRHQLVSRFGARFDVEVDSILALVLALNAALGTEIGLAAALLGLPRYGFGLAAMVFPWMRRALPDRFSRKVVCVLQLAALIALQAPILPPVLALVLVPPVAGALIWSFAKDVNWLWQRRA